MDRLEKPVKLFTKTFITVGLLILLALIIFKYNKDNGSLIWHEQDGYRWSALNFKGKGTGFHLLNPKETGINFSNSLTEEQIKYNQVLLNGSGVAVGDIDGDGMADIYFCRLNGSNVLYKNLGGMRFKDITQQSGVECPDQFSTGAALADIDGDGDLDLLVTSIGSPVKCFLNNGEGNFVDFSNESGLVSDTTYGNTTMALSDIEGDGDLDIYINSYKKRRVRDMVPPEERTFERIFYFQGEDLKVVPEFRDHFTHAVIGDTVLWFEMGEPDFLFINTGNGIFERHSITDGYFYNEDGSIVDQEFKDWGLMAKFHDMDDDGDPDLYVCNDFESPDRIWVNKGDGVFQAISKLSVRNTSQSTMAVDFSDIDRDGHIDFFLADMMSQSHLRRKTQMGTMIPTPLAIGAISNRPQYMRNTLFLNRGNNTFAEIAYFGGVHASEWSWSVVFMDVDLDGYEDLVISTGHAHDVQDSDTKELIKMNYTLGLLDYREAILEYPQLKLSNIVFRNRGYMNFENVSDEWGFKNPDISHGLALGDLDNDGDLDLVINKLDSPAGIYRNEAKKPRIAIRLKGKNPNTQAIGAKIRVLGGPVVQSKEVVSGGYYLSSSDPVYAFASDSDKELSVEVTWRTGDKSLIENVQANRIYEIYEEGSVSKSLLSVESNIDNSRFFKDVSSLINHFHHEDPFDDFKRQPLLPKRLSQLGPGISWYDINHDGADDLLISSGRGESASVYMNNGNGDFSKLTSATELFPRELDQTSVLCFSEFGSTTSLLLGYSNYESEESEKSYVRQIKFDDGKFEFINDINYDYTSIGPLALGDYDNDGDLDLFVGGRSIPGRYPEPANSRLYLNNNGEFVFDRVNSIRLNSLGLVSGAVFSDLNNDGFLDLVLSLEWGPITVFENTDGLFRDVTQNLGMDQFMGWWNGVTTGDLNGDGLMDILAANWGLNTKYHSDLEHPQKIYYGDFDNNGTVDILEAHFDGELAAIVPERGYSCVSTAMPYIKEYISSYHEYGSSDLNKIIGQNILNADQYHVNHLEHTVFLNGGSSFSELPMPAVAQLAPAFHLGVADYNGDGYEDIFLSQNFFSYQIETSRSDAGMGMWLQGDGKGGLRVVPSRISGIEVYGEQRGAAFSDFNQDGKVDLAVSQNGAETKLFQNIGAKPGLRVKLIGLDSNPDGIGASLRLKYGDKFGPRRELKAGSGYWSQNSKVEVLGYKKYPDGLEVTWPGGQAKTFDLPQNALEVSVDYSKGLSVANYLP